MTQMTQVFLETKTFRVTSSYYSMFLVFRKVESFESLASFLQVKGMLIYDSSVNLG